SYFVGACTGRSAGFSPLDAVDVGGGKPIQRGLINPEGDQSVFGDETAEVMGSNGAMIVPQDIKPKQTVRQHFRQWLIIDPRSSTCRVQLHWRLGQGADHGRMARVAEAWDKSTAPGATVAEYNLERKRTSSTSSAGLPKRRAADTCPCDASWPGPSRPCVSLDRYTQSTLNVARHAKKSEVEGEIESQIEYQEVQEGQASSAAQAAEGCCQHSGAGGCCNESSRLRRQARSRRSGVKRRRGATSF